MVTNVVTWSIKNGEKGTRNVEEHASEVFRRVREDHETIEVTHRDEVIAKIVPVSSPVDQDSIDQVLARWNNLIDEIASHGHDNMSADEAVREIRGDL